MTKPKDTPVEVKEGPDDHIIFSLLSEICLQRLSVVSTSSRRIPRKFHKVRIWFVSMTLNVKEKKSCISIWSSLTIGKN